MVARGNQPRTESCGYEISFSTDGMMLERILNDTDPIKLPLAPAHCTTSMRAVQGSECPQLHVDSAFIQGTQLNVDESRGEGTVG